MSLLRWAVWQVLTFPAYVLLTLSATVLLALSVVIAPLQLLWGCVGPHAERGYHWSRACGRPLVCLGFLGCTFRIMRAGLSATLADL